MQNSLGFGYVMIIIPSCKVMPLGFPGVSLGRGKIQSGFPSGNGIKTNSACKRDTAFFNSFGLGAIAHLINIPYIASPKDFYTFKPI
jgi:hypothetical protein